MHPFGPLASLLEHKPVFGWFFAGAATFFGSLPVWLADARDVLGIVSVVFGLAIGYLTIRIQSDVWRERRDKRRRELAERERTRSLDERPPWA